MLENYIRNGVLHDPAQVKAMKAINWQGLTDRTISMALMDPNKFFLLASMDLASEDQTGTFQMALAGLLINVVRAYLDSTGEALTERLSSSKDSSLSPKSLACPVCGSVASLSSIEESESSKSRGRKLFCACCGTAWPFETERCGLCGQTDPEKLDYVFVEEDPYHRLHICSACKGAMPTVFQDALKTRADYDVEIIATSLIQTLFAQGLLQKE